MLNKLFTLVFVLLMLNNCIGQKVHTIETRMLNVTVGIFTQLIVRHGDRTPKITWPTDLHSKSSWPTGFGGQMTLKGKQQCFNLGKWLRSHYGGSTIRLLNGYNPRAIYIRSADIDRCIQCVIAVAASMFPPEPQEILSWEIPTWHPVSVHTVPAELDYCTGDDLHDCPFYDKEYVEAMKSPKFVKYQADAEEFYANMSRFTGISVKGPKDAIKVRAELKVHKRDNRKLPDWADYVLLNEMFNEIRKLMLQAPTYTEPMAKIRSGFFLKEILDRARTAKDPSAMEHSMYMYSAHGKTMANLLHTLKMLPDNKPGSASVLMFESFDFGPTTYMRILFRNSSFGAIATPLFIPGCGWQCPIERMYELYEKVLPSRTYAGECAEVKDEEDVAKPQIPGPFTKVYWRNLWKQAFGWAM